MFALGRKAMTNLDRVLKIRDIILLTKLWFFQWSCTDVRVGPQRRLSTKELMLSNCGVGEDSLRVPWTARGSNRSILKEVNPDSIGRTDVEALILLPLDAKS